MKEERRTDPMSRGQVSNSMGQKRCHESAWIENSYVLFTYVPFIQRQDTISNVEVNDRRTRKGVPNLNSYVLFTYVGSGTQVTWYHHHHHQQQEGRYGGQRTWLFFVCFVLCPVFTRCPFYRSRGQSKCWGDEAKRKKGCHESEFLRTFYICR